MASDLSGQSGALIEGVTRIEFRRLACTANDVDGYTPFFERR